MSRKSQMAVRRRTGPSTSRWIHEAAAGAVLTLLNSVRDAVVIVDPRGRILVWNSAAEELLGYGGREMVGELFAARIDSSAETDARQWTRWGTGASAGEAYNGRWRARHGGFVDVAGRATTVRSGRRLIGLALLVHEVASPHDPGERQRLEREVVSIAEEERKRIGRDLHDSVCQELVAASLEAEVAAAGAKDQAAPEADALRQLATSLRRSAEELRQLARGLAPADLRPEELRSHLERLTGHTCKLFGVECTLQWRGSFTVGEGATATHLFRIAQEAISNAVRHGRARHVHVSVTSRQRHIRMAIRDDGIGIPADVGRAAGAAAQPGSSSIGITSMHYRAKMAGGRLDIARAKRRGTVVTCTIPLEARRPGSRSFESPMGDLGSARAGPRGRRAAANARLEILGPRLRQLVDETRALRERSSALRGEMRKMLERAREMNAGSFESRALAWHALAKSRATAVARGMARPPESGP